METLTEKQTRVLEFISGQITRRGHPPTVREIAAHFSLASTNAARRHLVALEKKGYIERSFNKSRAIALAAELRESQGIPIVGSVAAGTPITAVENLDGYLTLETLFARPDHLFCLRIKGDSMVDAGIWDGDYCVVRPSQDFKNGEIGVAIVDGEATVKRLRRTGRFVELIPANEDYPTIRVDLAESDFRYAGKVIGIHRAL